MSEKETFKPATRGNRPGIVPMPQQYGRTTNLPPAGHAQREELKQRTDTLTQEAEQRAATLEIDQVPDDALELDPEIMFKFDGFEVKDALPQFVYRWVVYDSPAANKGWFVKQAQIQGWQLVQGNDPEAKDNEIAGGLRKIGDTVLMRISKQRHALLQKQEDLLRQRQQESVNSNLMELGRKRGIIIKPIEELDPRQARALEARGRGYTAAKQQYERSLREGTLDLGPDSPPMHN